MIQRYLQNNGYELTIHVNFIVKYVCYMSLGSNGCFVTNTALMDSHYKTYTIISVGHPRSNLVISLMLRTVAYNGQGTGIV